MLLLQHCSGNRNELVAELNPGTANFVQKYFLHDCILSPYAQHFPVCRISQDIKECSNLNNKEISQLMRRTVERVIIVEICLATAECFCGYGIMVDTAGLKTCEERSPLLTGDCNSML